MLVASIVAMFHESEFYGHSGVLRTMALIKRDYVCWHLRHYVERYILSCDVCQAAKSRRVDTARVPRSLPVPDTKWHSVSMDWVSGLPPTTRDHDTIMTVVDRFSKRGMLIPCRKDVTLRAHLSQVPLNYPSETVVQPSSTAHFHYGFPTVEPLSWYSNRLLSSNLKTAIFQPCRRCHTP